MPTPTQQQVHAVNTLDNFSIAYLQAQSEYIAAAISPMVPVVKQTDRYFIASKADFFRDELKLRAPGTPFAKIGFGLTTDTFYCEQYAAEFPLPDEIAEGSDLDLERDGVELITQKALIRWEALMAAKVFAAGWTGQADQTGVAAGPVGAQFLQFDQGGAIPLDILETAIQAVKVACGTKPNTVAMGADVWAKLKVHADLKDIIKHTSPEVVKPALLAAHLEVDRVLIGGAVYNSANEGATATMARLVGKQVWLGYVNPSVTLRNLSAVKTFMWKRKEAYNPTTGMRLRIVRDENTESQEIRGDIYLDVKRTALDAGCRLVDAVA